MKRLSIIVFLILLANTALAQEPETLEGSCSANLSKVFVGDTVTWSANASGGDAPYYYQWSGDISGTDSSVDETYTEAGIKTASVNVMDSMGINVNVDCDTSVIVREQPEPLVFNSCSALPTESYIGDEVTWEVEISGGIAPYLYSITGDEGLSGDQDNKAITYTTAGTKTANIGDITDSMGTTISGPFNCDSATVYEPVESLSASCVVSDTTIDVGDTVTWSANASGGDAPYYYQWSGDVSGTDSSVDETYTEAGIKTASVNVMDSMGINVNVGCESINVNVEEVDTNNTSSGGGGSSSGGRRSTNNNNDDDEGDDTATSTPTTTQTLSPTTILSNVPTTGSFAGTLTTNTVVDNGGEDTSTTTDEVSTSTDDVIEDNNSGLLAGLFSLDLSFDSIWLWILILILILLMIALIYAINRKKKEDN